MQRWRLISLAVSALLARPNCVLAAGQFDPEFATTNDFGDAGLLQTPTARVRADGYLGFGVSSERPYNQAHFFLQLLPWLETSVRYTDVTTVPYTLANNFGNFQHYKDKSADFKIQLLQEGTYWPELAIGVQDFGGTGVFAGEFVVAGYHYYDFDFSLGLGWGRLGAGGDIPNPLGIFGHHFRQTRDVTQDTSGAAGGLGLKRLFTGRTVGGFGGVEWNTPIKNLRLKIEYDGNDYEHEALGVQISQASPVNYGLDYKLLNALDIGLGYERGNRFTAHLDLGFDLNKTTAPAKLSDPPPPTVHYVPPATVASIQNNQPKPASPNSTIGQETKVLPPLALESKISPVTRQSPLSPEELNDLVLKVKKELKSQKIEFAGLTYVPEAEELRVWYAGVPYRNPAKAAGRVARVLSNVAPSKVKNFTLIGMTSGLESYRISMRRSDFEKVAGGLAEKDLLDQSTIIRGPIANSIERSQVIDNTRFPKLTFDTAPNLRQDIGGGDTFLASQVWWRFDGGLSVNDNWSFSASIGMNIWNNFDQLQERSNSQLPHVRSDIAEYLKAAPNNLVRLESNYIWSPYDNLYARASAGIFEEMYGGIAAETLYRPYGEAWAVGLDVNYLRQRSFTERFRFRNYKVATGFATVYYRIPYFHVLAKLSVGRYLAKDKGATLDLSRQFASGVRCGIFATKTNVSAAQFGEGSFDKGLYITFPFDLFFTTSSQSTGGQLFRPLTRDGGQRASDGIELYNATDGSTPEDISAGWREITH